MALAEGNADVVPTRYPGAAWARLVLFALIGIAPAPVMVVGLLGIDLAELLDANHDLDVAILVVAVLVFVASIVLPLVCLKMRDPGPSRIVMDDTGITEWDGDDVRTAFPWAGASVFVLQTRIVQRGGGYGYVGGVTISALSERGHAINVGWGRGRMPAEARRRRMWSGNEFPTSVVLAKASGGARQLPEPVLDPRDRRRGLFVFARILGLLYLAAIGAGIAQATNDLGGSGAQLTGALFFLAGLLMALRSLRPIVENVRVGREAALGRGAVPVTFGGDAGGGYARATDAHGRPLILDLSAAPPHPDAWVTTRPSKAWVVLDAGASAGAGYRDAAQQRVRFVETERDRREHRRILWANRIEIAARIFVAVLLVTESIVLLAGKQVH